MQPNPTEHSNSHIICVLGPTACGKTRLAVSLAKEFNGEVVSVDSRQVYRGMDIGTGKDLEEYDDIPYHLIDVCDPDEEYNLFDFISDFNQSLTDINSRGALPILAGGTGMYLDAILSRYELTKANNSNQYDELSADEIKSRLIALNPEQHNETDLKDRNRTIQALRIAEAKANNAPILKAQYTDSLIIGIKTPRELARSRITERLKTRLDSGMIEEVEQLYHSGISWEKLHFFGLEYRYIAKYLQGDFSYNDMYQKLNSAIHKFAKQQDKWYRNMEKKGLNIRWIDINRPLFEQSKELLDHFLVNR